MNRQNNHTLQKILSPEHEKTLSYKHGNISNVGQCLSSTKKIVTIPNSGQCTAFYPQKKL